MDIKTRVTVILGDITTITVDAIVNAANGTLLGGGGVDGAIHRAAGPQLHEECRTLGGCQKGDAKITGGYNLPAKHIIHTVGPVFGSENGKEDEILSACYWNSLQLAVKHNLKSIAFPTISTGCYRFPKDKAAIIATKTVKRFLDNNPDSLEKIVFVVYKVMDLYIYEAIFDKIFKENVQSTEQELLIQIAQVVNSK